jgi:hypothetical protein
LEGWGVAISSSFTSGSAAAPQSIDSNAFEAQPTKQPSNYTSSQPQTQSRHFQIPLRRLASCQDIDRQRIVPMIVKLHPRAWCAAPQSIDSNAFEAQPTKQPSNYTSSQPQTQSKTRSSSTREKLRVLRDVVGLEGWGVAISSSFTSGLDDHLVAHTTPQRAAKTLKCGMLPSVPPITSSRSATAPI